VPIGGINFADPPFRNAKFAAKVHLKFYYLGQMPTFAEILLKLNLDMFLVRIVPQAYLQGTDKIIIEIVRWR